MTPTELDHVFQQDEATATLPLVQPIVADLTSRFEACLAELARVACAYDAVLPVSGS